MSMINNQQFLKRSIDIVGGLVGLIVSLPLIALAALAVWLEDHGPVFFIQMRAGKCGKPFLMYKLRSMRTGAETMIQEVLKENRLHGPAYKIREDPRVTRVGRFLRRWSIDELPQFLNVIKGEMSLVGPRPEEVWVVDQYSPLERRRLSFKPGMTGPMQINGRGDLDFEQRLDLELEYINHYSLRRDIRILGLTLIAVLNGKGSY